MGNSQTLSLYYLVAEDDDVQIDVAGAFVDELHPSVASLDSLESIKKLYRAE
jgi:hypothetical protein